MGPTNPADAPPGTIRGDFGTVARAENLVHGSDGPESADARKIGLFFPALDLDLRRVPAGETRRRCRRPRRGADADPAPLVEVLAAGH